MNSPFCFTILLLLIITNSSSALALSGSDLENSINWTAVAPFVTFVAITLWITHWAAKKTRTAADFYTAGGSITGFQNGLAIAGDFLSAAAFLGMSGLIFIGGYDGLIFMIGAVVGWPLVTILLAERLRNLGRFTFTDVAGYRFSQTPIRIFSACTTLVIVTLYLLVQMVGAGQLIKLLFGFDYLIAVISVGILMTLYVLLGGMTATTWVQIIKATLLLVGISLVGVLVLLRFEFHPDVLLSEVIKIHPKKEAVLSAGGIIKDPISMISISVAMLLGIAGLPHVLMRFFTVSSSKEARRSVAWATAWIAYANILIFFIGFGAVALLMQNPDYFIDSNIANGLRGGSNMAAVHLAREVGGDLLLGFISAVAFATILAVVSGLTLSGASAVSHDLYATLIKKGNADNKSELRVSRYATIVLGILAVMLGVFFEKQNVGFMVMLVLTIACSTNFPVLVMSLFWKNCTTRGAIAGGVSGLILSFVLMVLSPAVWEHTLGHPAGSAWFPYASPAIFSMPIAFFIIWLVSITDQSKQAEKERALYSVQQVRAETGLGSSSSTGGH